VEGIEQRRESSGIEIPANWALPAVSDKNILPPFFFDLAFIIAKSFQKSNNLSFYALGVER
jgi:hypothetical protein